MISNYIKISLRNIKKYKGFSLINIAGLAIGMACCILILMWVSDELSFDSFHDNAGELYQVVTEARYTDSVNRFRGTPAPLGPALKDELPEVLDASRYVDAGIVLVKHEDIQYYEEGISFADPSFLEMFSFPLAQGDARSALADPSSILITEEMAEKYFGAENPLGREMMLENQIALNVTGVLRDIPQNSHLRFDFLMSYELLVNLGGPTHWGGHSYSTYLLLEPEASMQNINTTLIEWTPAHTSEPVMYYLQPVVDIHLHDLDGGGFITYVYIFSAIALFVLLVACINFMNLSTARSGNRALEIGLRKVVGAHRKEIIKQFLSESTSLSVLALFLALVLVGILLPFFNNLSGKQLSLAMLLEVNVVFGFIALTLITGLLSGSYPAFFLSSFKPILVLRGTLKSRVSQSTIRKILVVFQFALSVILIISTAVVYKQYKYMRTTALGFDKEQLLYMPIRGDMAEQYDAFKSELLQNPRIESVAAASGLPSVNWGSEWGQINWEGKNPDQTLLMSHIAVDENFLSTMDMDLAYGRDFSSEFSSDTLNFILNETAIAEMGLEEPIGKSFTLLFRTGAIVGVVKDFHFASLRSTINPMILRMLPARFWNYIIVRIQPGEIRMSEVIRHLEQKWGSYAPGFTFEYTFLDEQIDQQYRVEQRTGAILVCFSVLTIFVACLGLFGLVSFMAERRTKEIGIRKVLGASISAVVLLLIREFMKWVLLANILAWPAAYLLMNNLMLNNYPYRITIGMDMLLLSGFFAALLSLLAVGYQAVKAARANPAESLKYE